MTAEIIYQGALRLIGESTDESDNQDYLDRAPYILGTFCSQTRGVDAVARKLRGKTSSNTSDVVYLDLDSQFPLLDDFAPAAELYLAAMLVIDYDAALYERLFERYCDLISTVCSSIESVSESTVNKYFMD